MSYCGLDACEIADTCQARHPDHCPYAEEHTMPDPTDRPPVRPVRDNRPNTYSLPKGPSYYEAIKAQVEEYAAQVVHIAPEVAKQLTAEQLQHIQWYDRGTGAPVTPPTRELIELALAARRDVDAQLREQATDLPSAFGTTEWYRQARAWYAGLGNRPAPLDQEAGELIELALAASREPLEGFEHDSEAPHTSTKSIVDAILEQQRRRFEQRAHWRGPRPELARVDERHITPDQPTASEPPIIHSSELRLRTPLVEHEDQLGAPYLAPPSRWQPGPWTIAGLLVATVAGLLAGFLAGVQL